MAVTPRTWLDAELGRMFNNGTELEILGGINWIGFTITRDDANNRYNFAFTGATPGGSSGQLQYNNAGAFDGAAGITVVGSETGLQLTYIANGATVASSGLVRVGAGLSAATQNIIAGLGTDSSTLVHLLRWGSSVNGQLILGATTATVGVSTLNCSVQSGGTFRWFTGASGTDIMALTASALSFALGMNVVSAPSATVTGFQVNGATVLSPVQGTDLTDADATINVSQGNNRILRAALTANRTITLGTTGSPETGEIISIGRFSTTAHTVAIVNGGAGAGTLYTFPVSVKRVADFRYDGTNWVFVGVKRLA